MKKRTREPTAVADLLLKTDINSILSNPGNVEHIWEKFLQVIFLPKKNLTDT